MISPRAVRLLRDLASHVLQVAEHDGAGRARLLARRHELAVPHVPALGLRLLLRPVDSLDAEGALLHHALLPHRDVRVQLKVERVRELVGEPVEPPHLVGAVVRAVPGAHASIVDLCVQSLRVVIRGVHGAHGLTRRVAALLTEHGLLHGLEAAVGRLLEVAVDLDPRHVSPLSAHHFADGGDVVLGVAGGDARAAPRAGVQVDRHPPAVGAVGIGVMRRFDHLREVDLVAVHLRQRRRDVQYLGHLPAVVRVTALQNDQPAALARSAHVDGRAGERQRPAAPVLLACQQVERVHAPPSSVPAIRRVALSERDRDRVRPDAAIDEGGSGHRARLAANRHEVPVGDTEPVGRLRVQLHPGVPDGARDRILELLHPGAVGTTTIVELDGRIDDQRHAFGHGRLPERARGRSGVERGLVGRFHADARSRRRSAAEETAAGEEVAPPVVKALFRTGGGEPASRRLPDVRCEIGFQPRLQAGRNGHLQENVLGLARVEDGRHQRLGDRRPPGAEVHLAPRLECVARGQYPVAQSRRLVEVGRQR